MRDRDPLEEWLFISGPMGKSLKATAERQAEAQAALDRLAAYLDNPPAKGRSLWNIGLNMWNVTALTPDNLARAQELYPSMVLTGGTGSLDVQGELLSRIALTADPSSSPFWKEMLDFSRPRDTFATKRKTMALAALAFLAIRRNEPTAYQALREAAHHANPEVRALAVNYLGRAYFDAKRQLSPEVVAELSEIAIYDKAFGPRFQARDVLRAVNLPVPQDNPEGVYAFKVYFKGAAKHMYRVIELLSGQDLDDLHYAIQEAIHWDADHLYSFYLNGQLYDERYAFACPHEDDKPRSTDEAIIGELGLVVKHKFLYYFDYGDSHQFEVEVVDIRPQAKAAKYPRVVEKHGKAPAQYGRWG